MKKILLSVLTIVILVGCKEKSGPEKYDGYERKADLKKPETIVDKMSYTFGYDITAGVNMMDSTNRRINFDYLIAGIIDGLEKRDPLMDDQERMKLVTELQKIQTENNRLEYNKKMVDVKKIGEKFKEIGPKYLEDNLKNEGWKVTSSGLQYKPIKVGNGKKPAQNMVVSANIRGELMNGEVFENTFEKNKPMDMPIEGLVYGFQEALMMMGEGDIYEFVIPPKLAFKDEGNGIKIPPYSVLKMKIQLVKIISTVDEYRKNRMSRPPGM